MQFINTGDRIRDNAYITFLTFMVTGLLVYISNNSARLYNKLLFIIYKSNPSSVLTKSYWLDDYDVIKSFESYRLNDELTAYIKDIVKTTPKINIFYKKGDSYADNYAIAYYITSAGNIVYAINGYSDISLYSKNKKDIFEAYGCVAQTIEQNKHKKAANGKQKLFETTTEKGFHCTSVLSNKKTFDSLFYDEKDSLVKILHKFKEGKMYPKNISMDNKLGILLYGPPGTGKTGTITAIANLLKRDVILINFSEIKTCKELDKILDPNKFKNYIYIFDEFDHILDALVYDNSSEKKEAAPAPSESVNWGELLACAQGEERNKILEMIRENKKVKQDAPINLAYLLSKLDGLEDNDGRMIIATTNNPDKINPVLLRPGRFDLKLCLGNCTTKMYEDILSNFFELSADERGEIDWSVLPVKAHSPLSVINAALQNQDLQKTIKALIHKQN